MSENVTRRAVLHGSTKAAAAAVIMLPMVAKAASAETDPVLEAWRVWRPLEEEGARLRIERDRIWEALPVWAKVPRARVGTQMDTGAPLYVHDERRVEELYGPGAPLENADRLKAKLRELAASEEAMDAEQRRSGYAELRDRIDGILAQVEDLEPAILEGMGNSPAAIAARIDLMLACSAPDEALEDYPHRVLCSIVRSLLPHLPADMAAALAPIAAEEGTIREVYLRGAAAQIGGAA